MINKLKIHQNMTLKDLESVSGGAVSWAAISVEIAAAKLTYDLSYAAGKTYYNLTH